VPAGVELPTLLVGMLDGAVLADVEWVPEPNVS
jgi:hypothetical protein